VGVNATNPRVVVLGAGFAGLRAVRDLARGGAQVLWVDQHNYHCFLPLAYQVATAGLEPQQIAYPVRSILHRLRGADFRLARVVSAEPAARTLATAAGDAIPYDYLIVATGGSAEDFGIPGVRAHTFGLYGLDDARRLRNHVITSLERATITTDAAERAALLTIVIVGGGPTGVEMGGALAEFRRHIVPRDYRHLGANALRVVLIEAGPAVLPPFPDSLRERARRDLVRFGVEVRTQAHVVGVDGDGIDLDGGERVPTRTVVWAAGIRAAPVAAALGLAVGRSGRIRVTPMLRTPEDPRVFAVGDVALVDGMERLPQLAQVAIQMGAHAAANVQRSIRGEPLAPFVYREKGTMATIGRSRAVAVVGRLHLAGALAWWLWLGVHLVLLVGFRNRLVVLVNWAWNYLTYDRGLRAIVGVDTGEATKP
jgi:NADH dehydrogenase